MMRIHEFDADIRTLEKDDEFWIVKIGLFESLGEGAGDILTELYTTEPCIDEIKEDIRSYLRDLLHEFQKSLLSGRGLSDREEKQFKVLKSLFFLFS